MPVSTADKRATFKKMHESGCFIIPNPFDVGSAVALQKLGFKALASTSAGFAWAIGKADNRVTLEEKLAHLTALCAAVDLPVNADFEGGEISFPEYSAQSFKAAPGTAVVFSASILHEVSRVTRGRRYVFLTFLFDEEAERVRQANLRAVQEAQRQAQRQAQLTSA